MADRQPGAPCKPLRRASSSESESGDVGPRVRVAGFDGSRVPPLKVQTKLTNLESPLNFARFYLPRLLPSLRRALYLDADVVVRGNLQQLWRLFATR